MALSKTELQNHLKQKEELTKANQEAAKELRDLSLKDGFDNNDSKRVDELTEETTRREKQLAAIEATLGDHAKQKKYDRNPVDGEPSLNNLLHRFMRGGAKAVSDAQRDVFLVSDPQGGDEDNMDYARAMDEGEGISVDIMSAHRQFLRDKHKLSAAMTRIGDGADTSAAEVIYEEHGVDLVHRLLSYGGVRQMCRGFSTMRGNDFPYPQLSAQNQEGERLGDTAARTTTKLDVPDIGKVTFKAFLYSSKEMAIYKEAIQDSFIALEPLTIGEGARRIGRLFTREATNGAGSAGDLPWGIKVASAVGKTAAKINAFTYDELVDMEHSVEYAYRIGMETPDGMDGGRMSREGQRGWMVHDSFVRLMKQLRDNDGRPLWLPAVTGVAPDMILGYPYAVNQALDSPAANAVPALFGNFGYFAVRDVLRIELFRYTDSAFTSKHAIGFQMFTRCDARPVGALSGGSMEAIKQFKMAAR